MGKYKDKLNELLTPDLNIYTVVIMARRDLEENNIYSAISRLKIDLDKFRCTNIELYKTVIQYFKENS